MFQFTTGLDSPGDVCENRAMAETLPEGPYRAYDLMTDEYLGGYDNPAIAELRHPDKAITVIYRPRKRKRK